jgi:hypothetical protein
MDVGLSTYYPQRKSVKKGKVSEGLYSKIGQDVRIDVILNF